MQHHHMDKEGIPKNSNALEDAQKTPKRSGNPIMADNLLLNTSNAMLASERFPQADESWEDLTKSEEDWAARKICTRQLLTESPR